MPRSSQAYALPTDPHQRGPREPTIPATASAYLAAANNLINNRPTSRWDTLRDKAESLYKEMDRRYRGYFGDCTWITFNERRSVGVAPERRPRNRSRMTAADDAACRDSLAAREALQDRGLHRVKLLARDYPAIAQQGEPLQLRDGVTRVNGLTVTQCDRARVLDAGEDG